MDDLILAILVGLAVSAIRIRDLLGAIAVLGAYSLVMAILWCRMNAVDVAFTEAAVGAGISTVLMLGAVARVGRRSRPRPAVAAKGTPKGVTRAGALLAVVGTAAGLLYAVPDMPVVGDPSAPATTHPLVKRWYLEVSPDMPTHPEPGDAESCAVWWVQVDGAWGGTVLDASIEAPGEAESMPVGRLEAEPDGMARLDREACAAASLPYLGVIVPDAEIVLRGADGQALFRGLLPQLRVANQGELDIEEGSRPLAFLGTAGEGQTVPSATVGVRRREHHGEVGPANVVTSVLGDYRGYDTMGETVVIFTAALCVVALLREAQFAVRRRDDDPELQQEGAES